MYRTIIIILYYKELYTNYTIIKKLLLPPKLQHPTHLLKKIASLFPPRGWKGSLNWWSEENQIASVSNRSLPTQGPVGLSQLCPSTDSGWQSWCVQLLPRLGLWATVGICVEARRLHNPSTNSSFHLQPIHGKTSWMKPMPKIKMVWERGPVTRPPKGDTCAPLSPQTQSSPTGGTPKNLLSSWHRWTSSSATLLCSHSATGTPGLWVKDSQPTILGTFLLLWEDTRTTATQRRRSLLWLTVVHHGRQQEDEASLSSCISSQKAQSEKEVVPGYKTSVLACLFFVNVIQVWVVSKEWLWVEKRPSSDWTIGKPMGHFLDGWLMWKGWAHCRWCCSSASGPGEYAKLSKS